MVDYSLKDLFNKNSINHQIKITCEDGTVIDNTMLHQEQFTLNESLCSESELRFGLCEASSVEFTTSKVDKSRKGQLITIKEYLDNNTDNPFTYGTYKVDSDVLSADRASRVITAYDSMYDIINTDVSEWYKSLTFPLSLKQFRNSFFTHLGIEQKETSLVNDDIQINKTIETESLSGKTVINAICEINGVFGHINRNNQFEYVDLAKSKGGESINIWDEQWEYGIYNEQTGEKQDNSLNGRNKNPIPVKPNTDYYLWFSNFANYGVRIIFYDSNMKMIQSIGMVNTKRIFSTPTNANYMCFYGSASRLSSQQLCINISNEAINGKYYPYNPLGIVINKSYKPPFKYEDYTKLAPTGLQIRTVEGDIGVTVGTTDNLYVVTNNFLCYGKGTEALTTIANNMFNVIKQVSYIPFDINLKGNPCNEVGDKVKVITNKNVEVNSIILRRTLTGIQGKNDNFSADGEEKYSEDINGFDSDIRKLQNKTNILTRTIEETKSEISSIETKTDNLDSDVTKAVKEASDALEKATGVETNLVKNYSTTTEMNTVIEQSANAIKQTVSESYTTKAEFNDLEVGGRNLLYKYIKAGDRTEKIDDLTVKVGTSVGDTFFWLKTHHALKKGETYTFSCDASNVPEGCNWSFGVRDQTSPNQLYINKNGRIYVVCKWDVDVSADSGILIDDLNGRPSTPPNIILSNFKLEKGNKPTDWTPAPEDMATQENVKELQSELSLQADQIKASVKVGESYNGMTINENGISIEGDGAFTVNTSNLQIDRDGTIHTSSADITGGSINIVTANDTQDLLQFNHKTVTKYDEGMYTEEIDQNITEIGTDHIGLIHSIIRRDDIGSDEIQEISTTISDQGMTIRDRSTSGALLSEDYKEFALDFANGFSLTSQTKTSGSITTDQLVLKPDEFNFGTKKEFVGTGEITETNYLRLDKETKRLCSDVDFATKTTTLNTLHSQIHDAEIRLLYTGGKLTSSGVGKRIHLRDDVIHYDELIIHTSEGGLIHCVSSSSIINGFSLTGRVNTSNTYFKLGFDMFFANVVNGRYLDIKACGFVFPALDLSDVLGRNGIINKIWQTNLQAYNDNRYVVQVIGIKYPTVLVD